VESEFPLVSLPKLDAPTIQVQSLAEVTFFEPNPCDNLPLEPNSRDASTLSDKGGFSMAHNAQLVHNGTVPTEDEFHIATPMQDDVCNSSPSSHDVVSSSIVNEIAYEGTLG